MRLLNFSALITGFTMLLGGCSWDNFPSTIDVVLKIQQGRTLFNSQTLQFTGSEVLILRITDTAGAIIAEENFSQTQTEYRLEKTGLELGKVFRAFAIFKDTTLNGNQTKNLDVKEFLTNGQQQIINLTLGHVGTIILEIPGVTTDVYPNFQSENFSYSGYSTNSSNANYLDFSFLNTGHEDTLTSIQFRFNGQLWQDQSLIGFEYVQFPLVSGLNVLEVRYHQESDNQWMVYRFTVYKN